MSNYTKPDDKNHVDKPEDWLFASLVFAKTIGLLLSENLGVVIDLTGDMCKYCDAKRVIISNFDNQIHVETADDRTDLNEGDWVEVINGDILSN